jgi:predicted Rossmann fold flavoprotein
MYSEDITHYDVIVIGAGAAGLMACIESGKRQRKTLLIEHTNKIGEKIRISGGGRCNFTNINASSAHYLSQNPHFIKSALAGFSQYDFIKLLETHQIEYHEKTLGQLFCNGSAKQIIHLLLEFCKKYQIDIKTNCSISNLIKTDKFYLTTNHGHLSCQSLVIASGGLSIPQIGASDFGYKIAQQFGLALIEPRPGLVPLLVPEESLESFMALSGVSNPSLVTYKETTFMENILFTHRGLSGPAILQISSYLEEFNEKSITINLLPHFNLYKNFIKDKKTKQTPLNYLKAQLTNRLVDSFAAHPDFNKSITDLSHEKLIKIADRVHRFQVMIKGSEGYRKAEVTVGGIDTHELSSKTMESKKVPNLFFIGEVVDVTGWLGGYNFQWAWSSGFAAGNYC